MIKKALISVLFALTQHVHLHMVFYYVHSCACLTFSWPLSPGMGGWVRYALSKLAAAHSGGAQLLAQGYWLLVTGEDRGGGVGSQLLMGGLFPKDGGAVSIIYHTSSFGIHIK